MASPTFSPSSSLTQGPLDSWRSDPALSTPPSSFLDMSLHLRSLSPENLTQPSHSISPSQVGCEDPSLHKPEGLATKFDLGPRCLEKDVDLVNRGELFVELDMDSSSLFDGFSSGYEEDDYESESINENADRDGDEEEEEEDNWFQTDGDAKVKFEQFEQEDLDFGPHLRPIKTEDEVLKLESDGDDDDDDDDDEGEDWSEDENEMYNPSAQYLLEKVQRRTAAMNHVESVMTSFLSQLASSVSHPSTLSCAPLSRSTRPESARRQNLASSVYPDASQTMMELSDFTSDEEEAQITQQTKQMTGRVELICAANKSRRFVWPVRTINNTIRLARLWKVLSLIYEALEEDVIVTKRDIYYKDPKLFSTQHKVNTIVNDLVVSSNFKRSDFNRASPKGLFASSALLIHFHEHVPVQSVFQSTLIPPVETISSIQFNAEVKDQEIGLLQGLNGVKGPKWILVVEKDAIFQSLCSARFGVDQGGVLITGKGYPDHTTQEFLCLLSQTFPRTPIAVLVDGDPDGIEILSVYTFGSQSQPELAVPRVQWLGVKAQEWSSFNIDYDQLIPLTSRDTNKIFKMLGRSADRMPKEWKEDLACMLHLRSKAEIQLLTGPSVSSSVVPSSGEQPTDQSVHQDIWSAPFVGNSTSSAGQRDHVYRRNGGIGRLVAYLQERLDKLGPVETE